MGLRFLESLQHGVLALFTEGAGVFDHEDPVLAFERGEWCGLDQALADVRDGVAHSDRRQPDQIGMGRRDGLASPAGAGGVGRSGREQIGRECPGQGGLAGALWSDQQVSVRWTLADGGREDPGGAGLARGGAVERLGAQDPVLPEMAAMIRSWTSSVVPWPSITIIRSVSRPAISR